MTHEAVFYQETEEVGAPGRTDELLRYLQTLNNRKLLDEIRGCMLRNVGRSTLSLTCQYDYGVEDSRSTASTREDFHRFETGCLN